MICLNWPWHNNSNSMLLKSASGLCLDRSQILGQTLSGQHFRLGVLTVLGVRVAERVLAVRVAAVMVVDFARVRSLILFNAELMVWSRAAQGETEDDTRHQTTCAFYRTHQFSTEVLKHRQTRVELWNNTAVTRGLKLLNSVFYFLQLVSLFVLEAQHGDIPKGIVRLW